MADAKDRHLELLARAAAGNLPQRIDDSSDVSMADFQALLAAGYLVAVDASTEGRRCFLNPDITAAGRHYLGMLVAAAEQGVAAAAGTRLVRQSTESSSADEAPGDGLSSARFVGHLILFPLLCGVSYFGAGIGSGMVFGRDIGFAGAGILLLPIPGAVLGLIGGYIAYALTHAARAFLARSAIALAASGCIAAALTVVGYNFMDWLRRPPDPDFVYLRLPDRMVIDIPREVVSGAEVPFKVVGHSASRRIPFDELPPYQSYFIEEPEPYSSIPQHIDLVTEPWGGHVVTYDQKTGTGMARFGTPGVYRVWAGIPSSRELRGNVTTITVRSTEKVYIPAANYQSRVDIEIPEDARVGEPFQVKLKLSAGPWQAVSMQDVGSARYLPEPPAASDPGVFGPVVWSSGQPGAFRLVTTINEYGIGEGVFSASGNMTVTATVHDHLLDRAVSSEAASIRILSPEDLMKRIHEQPSVPCPAVSAALLKMVNAELAESAQCSSCQVTSVYSRQAANDETCAMRLPNLRCTEASSSECTSIAVAAMEKALMQSGGRSIE
jgi:hypothetical protein